MGDVEPVRAVRHRVEVLENLPVARDTYRIRLRDPVLATRILPGQFVMLRPSGTPGAFDPLLGRPFALYDVIDDDSGHPHAIDFVYLVIGRGTQALARRRPGDQVDLWGPLGNGFTAGDDVAGDILLVAGGIGQTPFLALARWWSGARPYGEPARSIVTPVASIRLLYGVRSGAYAAGLADFERAGVPVQLSTDDGSLGHHGFVTDLLRDRLGQSPAPSRIVACGPPPMLAAVQTIAREVAIPCWLSLENHMACGFGACFSCVAPIRLPDGSVDLKRVCVEGPIFPADSVSALGHAP